MKPSGGVWAAAALIVVAAAVGVVAVNRPGGTPTLAGEDALALVDHYCTDCHNPLDGAGDVDFTGLSLTSVPAHAEAFEAAVRKLRGGLMPPPGAPRPETGTVGALIAWLEHEIDTAAASRRTAGHVPAQRLNRTEFAAAVEELLAVEVDPREMLPSEIEVDGFTNIAAALSTSPAFLEQYLAAARAVAKLAVGSTDLESAWFPPPEDTAQDDYVRGLPLGTRGGMSFSHHFPADGEYRFTITDLEIDLYSRAVETAQTVVILVDREVVFEERLGGHDDLRLYDLEGATGRAALMGRFRDIPVQVRAGRHEVVVTFVERARVATDELVYGFVPYGGFSYRGEQRVPRLVGGVQVTGPYHAQAPTHSPSRDRIFICTPETPSAERGCAERIAAHLATRAFRRPVTGSDLERLMPFFDEGHGDGGFDRGVEHLIAAVLASPDFLYRAIAPPATPVTASDGGAYPLSDLELASRLSFFLWNRPPDEPLLELAVDGRLGEPDVLDAQVARMLADPRAEVLVTDFALRWLDADNLDDVEPDSNLFPTFEPALREDFATEIRLFLDSVLRADRNVKELLTARHTYLNARLAEHYGVEGVIGPQFRRVELDNSVRHGLLGKGAVLLLTSYGDRTSPVLRGAWVLEKLMGTPPAPPPPGVETDLTTPAGEKPTTVRARLEAHRESPSCNGCHGVIDPYGLALENFTVIGEWRDHDRAADAPIDARTVLPDGRRIHGVDELRAALLARPDQFVQALTARLMMYAIGRELEHFDMPQVRAIVREAAKEDYRFSALVRGIVRSDAFRMQGVVGER